MKLSITRKNWWHDNLMEQNFVPWIRPRDLPECLRKCQMSQEMCVVVWCAPKMQIVSTSTTTQLWASHANSTTIDRPLSMSCRTVSISMSQVSIMYRRPTSYFVDFACTFSTTSILTIHRCLRSCIGSAIYTVIVETVWNATLEFSRYRQLREINGCRIVMSTNIENAQILKTATAGLFQILSAVFPTSIIWSGLQLRKLSQK